MTDRGLGSTYRVQVQSLGFESTRRLVPYLAQLGVETLYLSPVLAAAPGSGHGYDVIDPSRVDPALGTVADLEALFDDLVAHDMRALLDIVPNHMAAVPENQWWWDVLRDGAGSSHASTFDIDWTRHGGRVLVPALPRPLGDVVASGEVSVDRTRGVLELASVPFPMSPGTTAGDMMDMLREQHYRPASWRASATQGNYRRFFDINGLVGVRVEDEDVFEATHAFVADVVAHPAVAGVRVDHVDGLSDPAGYLRRLRSRLRGERTILVEKILAQAESLDPRWPADGTTGYEFADRCVALFVDPDGSRRLLVAGAELGGIGNCSFASLRTAGKRLALESFRAELDRLADASVETLDEEAPGHDLSAYDLGRAWSELTVHLPVYRTYLDDAGASEADVAALDAATRPSAGGPEAVRALATVQDALRQRARAGSPWLAIARRWQQLSGAVMAKGSEDTATYRYPGLLARTDVGGDPDADGDAVERFHQHNAGPSGGLNASSTHDSKRNEDARARLAVLSEADTEWSVLVRQWHADHALPGVAPDPIDELALYQSFVCLWPATANELDDETLKRVVGQALKGAREAKLRTSWTEPDRRYEEALEAFVRAAHADAGFRRKMSAFVRDIGPSSFVNALASVVLKVGAPGVPDFYQGTELLAPSLTDPDNRRPVDFECRTQMLAALPEPGAGVASQLLSEWPDGRLKLFVTHVLLQHRKANPALYEEGSYEPLQATTSRVVAFRRCSDGHGAATFVVPRLTYRSAGAGRFPLGETTWLDHALAVGSAKGNRYRDVLTGRNLEASANGVRLSEAFAVLPVAVLTEVG